MVVLVLTMYVKHLHDEVSAIVRHINSLEKGGQQPCMIVVISHDGAELGHLRFAGTVN